MLNFENSLKAQFVFVLKENEVLRDRNTLI